jgi:UPF0755 protein
MIWKHVAANALTVGIVVAACLAGVVQLGRSMWAEPGPLDAATFFEIERGASLTRVADALEEAGIVASAPVFRIGTSYADRDGDLKFGTYEIPAGATMPEVLDIITEGGPSVFPYTVTYLLRSIGPEYRVRERVPGQAEAVEVATFAPGEPVPEAYAALVERGVPITWRVAVAPGLTSWEVVEGLKGADFLSGEIPELPAEGMLGPDTFEVARGADRAELVARMAQVQQRRLAEAWAARQPELPIETPEEALILASIIEKETALAEERGTVAGVFVNRLRRGMRLQTDPTVIYGITEGRGALGRGIRASELRAATPWNTYVIDGLPPTPIANPSAASIRAAVDPEETSYVFFVADGTGGHAFAETLDEHNRNVAVWRRIEAERAAAQN